MGPDALLLPARQGTRFCLLHAPPADTSRGGIVCVHAFAEEMNKSRRVAALQARACAREGWTVLQPDLYGCGDSAGEFGDATWSHWVDDVCDAAAWLGERTGTRPVLWGVRTGCLVAVEAAARMGGAGGLVLWQPVVSGAQYLRQFLRLKSASGIVAQAGRETESADALRDRLRGGSPVEVAGYALSSALASGLEAAMLEPPRGACSVAWLEVNGSAKGALAPVSRACVERWRSAGYDVDAAAVQGDAFWQNLEVNDCPALIRATIEATSAWTR